MARVTETINLPSKGKLYPIKQLTLQNMTIAEEKFLYGSSSEHAVDNILKACITDEGVDIDELIVPDKHYALVKLRVLTYGEDYPVDLVCPSCGKTFTENVKLSNLEVDELPDDFEEPWEVTLPVSGDKLELEIPRNKDIEKFNDLAKRKSDKFGLSASETQYVFQTMLGIRSVNGDSTMIEDELYKYVTEMHAKDASYLKHEFSKIKVGYYTRLSCNCPSCNRQVQFRLPMTSDFFLTKFED